MSVNRARVATAEQSPSLQLILGFLFSLAIGVLAVVWAGNAQARDSGGGGAGRLGFSCDVNTRVCSCTGTYDGADCRAMQKNCEGGTPGGGGATILSCDANGCTCKSALTAKPPKNKLKDVTAFGSGVAKPKASTGSPTSTTQKTLDDVKKGVVQKMN